MEHVIAFPRHRLHRCATPIQYNERCFVCEGGLAMCETCGGAEASLPTHCPQARMSNAELMLVQADLADFRDGEWCYELVTVGSSA